MRARALNIYVCDQKSEGFELTDCFLQLLALVVVQLTVKPSYIIFTLFPLEKTINFCLQTFKHSLTID